MQEMSRALRELVESGPLAHLSTIDPDGRPQVSVIWIGLDGRQLVSGHMALYRKLRNIERDPRVVLSFLGAAEPGAYMNPYATLRARASVSASDDAWGLLDALAKIYVSADAQFPAPRGPGYIVHYDIEQVSGVGPWASR